MQPQIILGITAAIGMLASLTLAYLRHQHQYRRLLLDRRMAGAMRNQLDTLERAAKDNSDEAPEDDARLREWLQVFEQEQRQKEGLRSESAAADYAQR